MSRLDSFLPGNCPRWLPLVAEVQGTQWSAEALEMFDALLQHERSDERWLIVISAAAMLIASEATTGRRDVFGLVDDFGELAEMFELQLQHKIADAAAPCPSAP